MQPSATVAGVYHRARVEISNAAIGRTRPNSGSSKTISLPPPCQGSASEHEVGSQLGRNHLRHTIAKAGQVDAFEQGFTAAEEGGRHRQVHRVDRACEKVLADRRNA